MKHHWTTSGEKPWTCGCCGLYTANLRYIKEGYCRHDWDLSQFGPYRACKRCGVIENAINTNRHCIGVVAISLREDPTEMQP